MSDCKVQTLSAAECKSKNIPIYNRMANVINQPTIFQEIVRTGQMKPFQAMIMDMTRSFTQDAMGKPYIETQTKRFINQNMCCTSDDWTFKVNGISSDTDGNSKTVTVNGGYANNGTYARPLAGHRATISMESGSIVNVEIGTVTPTAGAWTCVFKALNGKTFNLGSQKVYKVVMDKMKLRKVGDASCIATHSTLQNGYQLTEGFVEAWENGICINEDDVYGLNHESLPLGDARVIPLWDSAKGEFVDSYTFGRYSQQLEEDKMYSASYNAMFGERDYSTKSGIDGYFTQVNKSQMFHLKNYDLGNADNFKNVLRKYIRMIKRSNLAVKTVCIWVDDIAGAKINDAIMKIGGARENFVPLIQGFGTSNGMVEYYNFGGVKNFENSGIDFVVKNLEIEALNLPHMRDFAHFMPIMKLTDSTGKTRAPIELVKLKGMTGISSSDMWTVDLRLTSGCRDIKLFARDSYGYRYNCLGFAATVSGNGF